MPQTQQRDAEILRSGRRVLLRRPTAADEAELLHLNRHSRRLHWPWMAPPTRSEHYAAYLQRCERQDFEGLLVCERSSAAIVGVINFSQIVHGPLQSAYTGYYAGAGFAGRGYMTDGLRLAVRHAFQDLKLHRLEANIQPGNAASIALARRVGFRLEGFSPRYLKIGGRWRDHERWALLRDQVRPSPPGG